MDTTIIKLTETADRSSWFRPDQTGFVVAVTLFYRMEGCWWGAGHCVCQKVIKKGGVSEGVCVKWQMREKGTC